MTPFDDRVLALGALLVALSQVRRIAETGQSDTATLQLALDSVFRLDAADTAAAVGGVDAVRPGLRLLRDYLAGTNKDEALGKLAMAVLDVFEQEPLPADSPLWGQPNLIVTPHNSAYSFPEDVAQIFIRNYIRFIDGQQLDGRIDFDKGY